MQNLTNMEKILGGCLGVLVDRYGEITVTEQEMIMSGGKLLILIDNEKVVLRNSDEVAN